MSSNRFKKSKGGKKDAGGGGDDKELTLKLSHMRYLDVTEFRNKTLVSIREYYLNDAGRRMPGKKGISLSLEEWKKIVDNLDTVQKAIKNISGESDDDSDNDEGDKANDDQAEGEKE